MTMHAGQLEITTETATKLVAQQFPLWETRPVTAVASHGTVNALFRLGHDLVARFPLVVDNPDIQRSTLEQEFHAARRLRRLSPFPTPEPVAIAPASDGYPAPWAVYTWLRGNTAGDGHLAESTHLATEIAEFILALRQAPTGGRVFTGAGRGGDLRDHDAWVDECLSRSTAMIDVDTLRRIWTELRNTARGERDVWSHGDLMPGNLLVDGERLIGVIDVGQFDVADPALDLQPAWNLFGPRGRMAFRAAIGCDDDQWARGKGWALTQAIGGLWYYRDTNPVMSETARITLEALLNDH